MKKIAIIGGDRREAIVAETLRFQGYDIAGFALENEENTKNRSLQKCLFGADALILPVRADDGKGNILGKSEKCPVALGNETIKLMKKDASVFAGVASDALRKIIEESGHTLKEIMEEDKVAVPNAALTAEATLAFLMDYSDTSIRKKTVAVFGFGRVGRACGEIFSVIGCRTAIFCRKEQELIRGRKEGFDVRLYGGLPVFLPKTDILINTVPAKIVTGKIIASTKKECLLVDLASSPGGIDIEAAEKIGRKHLFLPGLPGKYAPVSAGEILASYYSLLFSENKGGYYG